MLSISVDSTNTKRCIIWRKEVTAIKSVANKQSLMDEDSILKGHDLHNYEDIEVCRLKFQSTDGEFEIMLLRC